MVRPVGIEKEKNLRAALGYCRRAQGNEISGRYGEIQKVSSIQNASGNGLDIVALRLDGKYDIFEVKSSKRGNFRLSERQQKGGKCFAEQVLMKDVKKGGYFMKGLDGKETPIGPKEAREIFNNIDKTETVFVDMNSKFRATRITFGPW